LHVTCDEVTPTPGVVAQIRGSATGCPFHRSA
jgi:hypothetical protein